MTEHLRTTKTDELEREMAINCYGYGRWEAPYWFIGPEQGKGPKEPADNVKRIDAWAKLGKTNLCDCRCFHEEIDDFSRHREMKLQPTWRRLMLLLMVYLGKDADIENLRTYQRDHWGMLNGETCVIELSGVASKNLKTSIDHKQFRQDRIEFIRDKRKHHRPALVIMYGISAKKDWEQIAGHELKEGEIVQCESTIFGFTRHPVAHRTPDQYWKDFGVRLREYRRPLPLATPRLP